MNIENIDKAIAIMKRAQERDSVDMFDWQSPQEVGCYSVSEHQLHACGNKACFAGHIAVSPEWKADGGGVTEIGSPIKTIDGLRRSPEVVIADWLGVSVELTSLMIYGDKYSHPLYGVAWEDVRAEHVIKALEELKELGEEAFAQKYSMKI